MHTSVGISSSVLGLNAISPIHPKNDIVFKRQNL